MLLGLLGFLRVFGDGSLASTRRIVTVATGLRPLVCALMLFHVVLARKGFVADGAMDPLLASVLLSMTRSVARGGECSLTIM